jgi:hypothetical protein
MRVYGVEVTEDQLRAGVAAMIGEFRMSDVLNALTAAGVSYPRGVAGRAADRLLQRERKAGRIVAVNNKLWRATAD